MRSASLTFGQAIANRRRELGRERQGFQLKDVAARVMKEDGQPISIQYLSDLEHDRRAAPSDRIIDELARELMLGRGYLYLLARRLPPDFEPPSDERVGQAAFKALCDIAESYAAA